MIDKRLLNLLKPERFLIELMYPSGRKALRNCRLLGNHIHIRGGTNLEVLFLGIGL